MDPVHPTLVHIPILLTLVGSVTAAFSIMVTRRHLPLVTAALLVTAAIGAFVAVNTGREAKAIARDAGQLAPGVRPTLDAHELWAQRSLGATTAAALAALASALLTVGGRRGAGPARALTAALALVASLCVYKAGEYGGTLVAKHGLGPPKTAPVLIEGFGAEVPARR